MKRKSPPSEETDLRLLEALASLNQISGAINQINAADADKRDISLKLIVESSIRVVPGSSAVIYTYDHFKGQLEWESRVSAGGKGKEATPDDVPRSNGIGMRAIQRRRKTLSYEESDLEIHPYHAALGVKAVVCYPLIVAGQVVGVLYVYLHEEREFTQLEQLMLDNFVNQAAMAIYHVRHLASARRDLAHKDDELKRLRRAGMLISSRLRLKETLESILQLALEVTHAQYGIFRLLDKSGEFLVTSAVYGAHLERPLVEKLPLNGNGIMAYVARSRESLLVADLRQEPWSKVYYPLDSNLEMRSELAVPLINASGRLEGVLNVESPDIGAFSDDDNHMLQTLATYAITAIQEVRLLDALQDITRQLISQPYQKVLDHLTRVANDLLNASASGIWTMNSHNGLALAASSGELPHAENLPLRENLAAKVLVRGEESGARFTLIPLLTGDEGQASGVFGVFHAGTDGGRFAQSEWDEKILTSLAQYAALAIQNESRQQALRASREQHWTAETFAAVGDISANLLHNMNNKVGTIPVRVQTIQDKYSRLLETDTYLAKNLAEIERSAMDALQIVQENLSHLRPIRMEQVDVAACVMDAIHAAQLPADVEVKTEALNHLPKVVAGTKSLTLVFKNLIENAIAAMKSKGAISISGIANAQFVEISVRDSGPGIPPDLHEKIFELDFSARGEAHPGKLGFGLWWVKTLMTRLGGSVTVESDGSHGATFVLRLPCAETKP